MIEMIFNVCWAEGLKLRRSRAPLMGALAYAMAPPAAALLMLAGRGPSQSWQGYLAALAAASASGGLVVFGLLLIWIFGRERAERHFKELLTLPVPRQLLAAGKFMVAALACLLLQCGMLAFGLLLGACLDLQGSSGDIRAGMGKAFCVAALSFCLATPLGLLASLSRGILGAVAGLFMALFFAALLAALGWGAFFPWSIPGLYSLGGAPSLAPVWACGLAGVLGCMAWWRCAEQK
jgi:ABC-2 type transport system permease protein